MSYEEFLENATATFHTGWMTGTCTYDVRYNGQHVEYVICDNEDEALSSVYERHYKVKRIYQTR